MSNRWFNPDNQNQEAFKKAEPPVSTESNRDQSGKPPDTKFNYMDNEDQGV